MMPSFVPRRYRGWVRWDAQQTGLPVEVVAYQIEDESHYDASAVSSAGAEGIAQFEPTTFSQYGSGSPFNPPDAFRAYAKYTNHLLDDSQGNVRNALAAYNAGEGNVQAGLGYADTILAQAGEPADLKAGTVSSSISTTSIPGLSWLTDPVDSMERIGLVLLGALLVLLGIAILGFGPATRLLGMGASTARSVRAVSGSSSSSSPSSTEDSERRMSLAERNSGLGERKQALAEKRERRLALAPHKQNEPNPNPQHG